MKLTNWIVVFSSLVALAGCANKGSVIGDDGAQVAGSALIDKDKDGIADSADDCLDSTLNALVDESGCEVVMGVIRGLTFAPNQVELSADAEAVLGNYVEVLKRYPDVVVSVEAHTDNRGKAMDNLELSKQRVLAVAQFMVSNGIPASQLKPYGRGESRPRAANATAQGREQNRRIEIKVIAGLL